jgi:hypothetical protein
MLFLPPFDRGVLGLSSSEGVVMSREYESLLLDRFLPHYHFSEVHAVEVKASSELVFDSVMACNLTESSVVRTLFRLRRLPRGEITVRGLEEIGFRILGVHQNREVVMGIVGRFWRPSAEFVPITADEFGSFDSAGYAKAAGNFLVQPLTERCTRLTTETRIWCTSSGSRVLFGSYWTCIRPFSGLIRREWLRRVKGRAERHRR